MLEFLHIKYAALGMEKYLKTYQIGHFYMEHELPQEVLEQLGSVDPFHDRKFLYIGEQRFEDLLEDKVYLFDPAQA